MTTNIDVFETNCMRFTGKELQSVLRDVADWIDEHDQPTWHIVVEFSGGINDDDDNIWAVFIYRLAAPQKKDTEIQQLHGQIKELEEHATWEWARHREIEHDELPVPRLQMSHRIIDKEEYNQEWIYSLVYKHLLGHSVEVPLGCTKVSGSFRRNADIDNILPFRDRAHFKHDMRELGLPGYVIYQGNAVKYTPKNAT